MSRRHFRTSCVAVHICNIRPFHAISNRLVLGYMPSYNFLCLRMWVLAGGVVQVGGGCEDLHCGCAGFDIRQDYFCLQLRVEVNFRARQLNLWGGDWGEFMRWRLRGISAGAQQLKHETACLLKRIVWTLLYHFFLLWLCVWSLSTIYDFCFKNINIKIRTQNLMWFWPCIFVNMWK